MLPKANVNNPMLPPQVPGQRAGTLSIMPTGVGSGSDARALVNGPPQFIDCVVSLGEQSPPFLTERLVFLYGEMRADKERVVHRGKMQQRAVGSYHTRPVGPYFVSRPRRV
jgi:hypothetical protein